MADFAKAQLLKYGWTEGKGLGKNEDGITDALRPKLKFDNHGVGHDGKECKWWERVYDAASKNINIRRAKENVEDIVVERKDSNCVEISASILKKKKLSTDGKSIYGNFLKTCTLDEGKIIEEERDAREQKAEENSLIFLTDEELFRACGGRTAHKGARHGLKLSGKLARVAQQEAELLKSSPKPQANGEWIEVKKRKKKKCKRKRCKSAEDAEETTEGNAEDLSTSGLGDETRSEDLKQEDEDNFQELSKKLNDFSLENESLEKDRKVGKKRRRKKSKEREGREGKRRKDSPEIKEEEEEEEPRESINNNDDLKIVKKSRVGKEGIQVTDTARDLKKKKKKRESIFSEAETANYKIEKKKKKSSRRKEEKRLQRITDCLMSVDINEDSVDSGRGEDLICNSRILKKLKKLKKSSGKKTKKKKKIQLKNE